MNYQIAILCIVLAALLPASVHAQVISNVSASSDTGGNTAESGTVTTGASSASVKVENISGGGGGTATVHIETSVNGQTHEETYTMPGGSIGVSVVATSSGYEAHVWEPGASTPQSGSVHRGAYALTSLLEHNQASTSIASSIASSTAQAHFIGRISSWFERLFNIFGWFGK
ncbi:MAG: hypothetical protein ABSE76_00375 [Minisyncoccia bacterium]|jgi:hypothetical protein